MSRETVIGTYTVEAAQAGQRLDVALSAFLQSYSLREIRHLWSNYLIELNNRYARKGMLVKAGDLISINASPDGNQDLTESAFCKEQAIESGFKANLAKLPFPEPDIRQVRVLKNKDGILALFKPAGLHSAALAGGRGGVSLEEMLPLICKNSVLNSGGVQLFNRLDCLTTGIVLACEDELAMCKCVRAEQFGGIEKRYFAVVSGRVHSELVIKNDLDTDSRAKTRVLSRENRDPLRHTLLTPLYSATDREFGLASGCSAPCAGAEECTLVQATILRGARHQIRAHLASAGYPIWGDPIYNQAAFGSHVLYLHHYAVSLPGFVCVAAPLWTEAINEVVRGLFPGLVQC